MLFAAAIESQADYIVTGDKLLQRFNWTGQGKVISPRDFCDQVFDVTNCPNRGDNRCQINFVRSCAAPSIN